MEFHLPYYALRRSPLARNDERGLRRSGKFIPIRSDAGDPEYLYEAQISVLIVGIDEWFWTAYCCTETHFSSEESIQFYKERGLDAPTGGAKPTHYPVWNPRDYWLLLLSLRLRQTTKEWANVVNTLDKRLQYHVRKHRCPR